MDTENIIDTADSADTKSAGFPEGTKFQEFKERQRYKRIAVKIKRRRMALLCGAVALLLLFFFMSSSMLQYAVVSGRCIAGCICNSAEPHKAYGANKK